MSRFSKEKNARVRAQSFEEEFFGFLKKGAITLKMPSDVKTEFTTPGEVKAGFKTPDDIKADVLKKGGPLIIAFKPGFWKDSNIDPTRMKNFITGPTESKDTSSKPTGSKHHECNE